MFSTSVCKDIGNGEFEFDSNPLGKFLFTVC